MQCNQTSKKTNSILDCLHRGIETGRIEVTYLLDAKVFFPHFNVVGQGAPHLGCKWKVDGCCSSDSGPRLGLRLGLKLWLLTNPCHFFPHCLFTLWLQQGYIPTAVWGSSTVVLGSAQPVGSGGRCGGACSRGGK